LAIAFLYKKSLSSSIEHNLKLEKSLKTKYLMKIKAIIHSAEEGGYWAEVPALPGCITEGDTMEELMSNLQDAIQGWLEVANESTSTDSTAQIVEIAL
jgi:predicted RNase H-like HicB family nuclease